ncbi:swr complex subunit [Coemansia erecta]|uniref:SWR1-complex protein 4 n=1 Tax=Coemansia erecta TaxID=147472 RepID=A0A9W7Y5X6_9FUNG|nr:swr complex subunit [Coemansia erecta]
MFSQKPKQKAPGLSRELNSLYLENQTIPVPLDTFQAKPKFGTKAERWIWRGFKSSARNDNLALYHWVKANEQYSDYFYAQFNAKTKPYEYTDEEYTKCIESLDAGWTRAETDYLLGLCKRFDMRFIVIHDRYYSGTDCPEKPAEGAERSLEDLKDRYYSICRALIQYRSGEDSQDPEDVPLQATNKLADDLALLRFDKKKEQERKEYLEALFSRTKEEIEEEEILIIEARRIEANERRLVHEREALLHAHALFEEAPASATIPTVKVQFSQAPEPATPLSQNHSAASLAAAGDTTVTPKVRKGAPDSNNSGDASGGARALKKQKSVHGIPPTPRMKSSAAANKAMATSVAASDAVSGRGSSVVRSSMSPSRATSAGVVVKHEHGDGPVQFGPVTFATEEHLVHPAVIQVDTPETGPIFVSQRDSRLGPGVFLRSDKLHPIPKNKLDSVKQFMAQLQLSSPNTIWPRPVMATAAVCDRFDSLQSTIIPLLDCKKAADKLETEIQVLRTRRRMLMNDIGVADAEAILSKLPPIDASTVLPTYVSPPLTPTIESTTTSGASRHNRKGSTASARKKSFRD